MSDKLFFGHPRGLMVCFLTEMWERFSYYGMRALLIFYLTQHFLYSDGNSYLIYGAYSAMVYMMPVLGGILSDQFLGARRAVTLGAVLLTLGHLGLVFEGPQAIRSVVDGVELVQRSARHESLFYLSLALIVTGVGFLKTNISAMVGLLYEQNDPRRDSGFTIFYMGINLGGAIAPLICGWLGQTYGWGYGFGLAGIGMLVGLMIFLRGQHLLQGCAEPLYPERLSRKVLPMLSVERALYLGSLLLVAMVWWLLQHRSLVGPLLSIVGVVSGVSILYYSLVRCDSLERQRLWVCAVLILFTLGFWALYEQMGSSLALFSDRLVDRNVFGYEVPAASLQSLPALLVLLLAPLFSLLWPWLASRGLEPSTPVKFALGIALMGLAFFTLVMGSGLTEPGEKVALFWFVLTFLLMVSGELCLAPVGTSMVTKLAPRRIVSVMMGMFLLAYSASSFIASLIARMTSVMPDKLSDFDAAIGIYTNVYQQLGTMAVGISLLLLLLVPVLRRGMRGIH